MAALAPSGHANVETQGPEPTQQRLAGVQCMLDCRARARRREDLTRRTEKSKCRRHRRLVSKAVTTVPRLCANPRKCEEHSRPVVAQHVATLAREGRCFASLALRHPKSKGRSSARINRRWVVCDPYEQPCASCARSIQHPHVAKGRLNKRCDEGAFLTTPHPLALAIAAVVCFS